MSISMGIWAAIARTGGARGLGDGGSLWGRGRWGNETGKGGWKGDHGEWWARSRVRSPFMITRRVVGFLYELCSF